MKYLTTLVLLILILLPSKERGTDDLANALEGAWELESINGQELDHRGVLILQAPYIFYTEFNFEGKEFIGSQGGTIEIMANKVFYKTDFNTWSEEQIGQQIQMTADLNANKVTLSYQTNGVSNSMIFNRIDNGQGDLAGAWRITGRMRGGEMQTMRLGPRKTIKMVTGTRFQWAAFNPETKEFSGTGGGKIGLENGKYTEYIEFFSRNADRVGAVLNFNYSVEDDKWDHSGESSSGEPIREIWTKQ